MSRWKITLEYTDDEGHDHAIVRSNSWGPSSGQISAFECFVLDMAFITIGLESLGIVPGGGPGADEVVETFSETIYDSWPKEVASSAKSG